MKKINYIIVLLLVAGIAILYVYIRATSYKLILGISFVVVLASFLLACLYRKREILINSRQEKEDAQIKLIITQELNGDYIVGNMVFKPKEHSFYKGDERKKVSRQMTQMLLVFFVRPDFLVLREELIELWDPSYNNDVKLNTGILRLREKLGEIKCPLEIATERNIGYRLIYKEIIEDVEDKKVVNKKPVNNKKPKKKVLA